MEVYRVEVVYTNGRGEKTRDEFVVPVGTAWEDAAAHIRHEWAEEPPMILEVNMWWLGERADDP